MAPRTFIFDRRAQGFSVRGLRPIEQIIGQRRSGRRLRGRRRFDILLFLGANAFLHLDLFRMSFLCVQLCSQAPKRLRFCGGEVALADIRDITEQQLKRTFQTNIFSMFFMVQAAAVGFLEASMFIVLVYWGGEVCGN